MSCSPEAAQEGPVQMPVKENTWVRKETVSKSSASINAYSKEDSLPNLSVDSRLAKKLREASPSSLSSEEECLAAATALDKRRTAIQKRGGAWHVFEKTADARKYTDYGMQIDSQLNRLVFSLKQLCRGAKGMPLDGWGRKKVEELQKYGKEKMREMYVDLGNDEADVDKWIAYAQRGIDSKNRNIPYSEIGESIARTDNLVSLYENLSVREIDDSTLNAFLTDASTLLSVIKDSLVSDPRVALAIEDDNMLPSDENGIGNEM
ncbi:MAG: hypothetical protein VW455_02905 [Nitrospinota bacterium]